MKRTRGSGPSSGAKASLSLSFSLLSLSELSFAGGTIGDCSAVGSSAAPASYYPETCDGVCTEAVENTLECDLQDITGGCTEAGSLTMVTDYNKAAGGPDFSIWGECGTTKFCCIFSDEATPNNVTTVIARGTAYNDSLHFDYGYKPTLANQWDLGPHRNANLNAFQYGGAGNDMLEGSHYVDTPNLYRDNLYGEADNDTIDGNDDGDWLSGGDGDDTMKGDDGADSMDGGRGNDSMTGETGDDTVCDDSYDGTNCADQYGNVLYGGAGNDTSWYTYEGTCTTAQMSTSSTAGTGTNVCGTRDINTHWTDSELPAVVTCQSYITTAPAACTDPN